MIVEINSPLGNRVLANSTLTTRFEVAFDASAQERAWDLIEGLQRHNYQPRRLVAGLRAFLSLYSTQARPAGSDIWDHDALHIVVTLGGQDDFRFQFRDVEVELDMTTEDPDDLRVTCGSMGLALVCAAQPDVQIHRTMEQYFAALRRKVSEGRILRAYVDERAFQLGFSDGDEHHAVHLTTLRAYYDAPHFRPLDQARAIESFRADMTRILQAE